jgi:hypothetical protein
MLCKGKKEYFADLVSQGQDHLHVCPACFREGRKKYCRNAVYLREQNAMVCCWLGEKATISEKEFNRRVRIMMKKFLNA